MERSTTRASKRKTAQREITFKETIKKVKNSIVAESEGEEEELTLPSEIIANSTTMAVENAEMMREMNRVMIDSFNQQLEATRQFNRDREEQTLRRFQEMFEDQGRNNKAGVELLTSEFEKMRLERELSRGMQTQRLPNYDGSNLEVDEWQDRCEAVLVCNKWSINNMLAAMPTVLSGAAKRAFDSLMPDDKGTKDLFFTAMRLKIDPISEKKNKENFVLAKKMANESIASFIDRCKMYIRRSGGDTSEKFAVDMLKLKVTESLNSTDRKILNATIGPNETLESIIIKADSMLTTQTNLIGAVGNQETGPQYKANDAPINPTDGQGFANTQGYMNDRGYGNNLEASRSNQPVICYRCNRPGHVRRQCWLGNNQGRGMPFQTNHLNNNNGRLPFGNNLPPRGNMNGQRRNGPNMPYQPNMQYQPIMQYLPNMHMQYQPNVANHPNRPYQQGPPYQQNIPLQQNAPMPEEIHQRLLRPMPPARGDQNGAPARPAEAPNQPQEPVRGDQNNEQGDLN